MEKETERMMEKDIIDTTIDPVRVLYKISADIMELAHWVAKEDMKEKKEIALCRAQHLELKCLDCLYKLDIVQKKLQNIRYWIGRGGLGL